MSAQAVCARDGHEECHVGVIRYAGIDPKVWAYDYKRRHCPWLPEAIDGCYRVDTDAILDERFPRERTGGADWSVRSCWRVGVTSDGFGVFIVQDDGHEENEYDVTLRKYDDVTEEDVLLDAERGEELGAQARRVHEAIALAEGLCT